MPKRKKKKNRAKLKLHPAQSKIFLDQTTHRTMCCSRRFGKSVLLRAMVCDAAINFKGHYSPLFPSVVAIIMPTLKQARSIHWNPLCDLLRGHPAVEKIIKSDFRIVIKGNRPDIILRGCNEDGGDSLRGLKLYMAAFDEVQDVKEIVWVDVVSPALADTKDSKAVFCGCVNPETRVITPKGMPKIGSFDSDRIENQWTPIDEQVWSEDKKFDKADGVWNNGFKATLKIETHNGYSLEGTYNHPVKTRQGWKKLEDIDTSDEIAIDYGMDIWGKANPGEYFVLGHTEEKLSKRLGLDFQFSYLAGYMQQRAFWRYTEGVKSGVRLLVKHKPTQLNFLRAKSIGGLRFRESNWDEYKKKQLILDSKAIVKWLEFLDIDYQDRLQDRKLPEWLFNAPRSSVIAFIKGYTDSKGSLVYEGKKARKRVKILSRSEEVIRGLHLLLTNLGIVSKICKKKLNNSKGSPKVEYFLYIRGEFFNKFKKIIGFTASKYREDFNELRTQKETSSFSVDEEYLWDKIVSIRQGACKTIDFTVPESNSYWANGIIVHNTPKGIGTFFHNLFMNADNNPEEWSSFHQTCYDNPYLDRDKLETQKRNLPPKIFRQEFMASWESFDGQIYSDLTTDNYIEDGELPKMYEEFLLGVDWGDINPALVVCGYANRTYYLLDYWLNPNPGYAIEQRHHDNAAVKFCIDYNIERSYADPSQPGRILSMRKAGVPKLISGYNRVEEGNGIINTMFFQKRIRIRKKCKEAYEKLMSYHRDKKDGIILDKVAPHQDDHLCDALRYLIATREHKNFNKEVYGELLIPRKELTLPKQVGGLYSNVI